MNSELLIERLKDVVSFSSVLSYFSLDNTGDCPSGHASKNHNCFHLHPSGSFGKCFHCGRTFDIFDVTTEQKGLTFSEAFNWLAETFGAQDLAGQLTGNAQPSPLRASFLKYAEYYEAIFQEYHTVLLSDTGQEALDYLLSRGFSKEEIAQSEWCYFPPQKTIRRWLTKRYPNEKTLFFQRDEKERYVFKLNGFYGDYFRLAFPYRNRHGVITGFVKRSHLPNGFTIEKHFDGKRHEGVRYDSVFHTDLPIYKKHDLFGSHALKGNSAIIVEGYPDALMFPVLGIHNVTAVGQGLLAKSHIESLKAKRITSVILALDNDPVRYDERLGRNISIGYENTKRAIELLVQEAPGIQVSVVNPKWLSPYKDPDEVRQGDGVERVRELLERAKREGAAIRWIQQYLHHSFSADSDLEKRQLFEQVINFATMIANPIDYDDFLGSVIPPFKRRQLDGAVKQRRLQQQKHSPEPEHEYSSTKPSIYLGSLQDVRDKLYDVTELAQQAWKVILQANTPEQFFLFAQQPAFVNTDGQAQVEQFTPRSFTCILNDLIDWLVSNSSGMRKRPCLSDVASHMLNNRALGQMPLPELVRIVESPYFTKYRKLHVMPGYNKDVKTYYHANGQRLSLQIPEKPTSQQVTQAKHLIYELLQDFPFASEADRTHAICLFLQPFIRTWFPTTPLYDVEAAKAGTGKTKLVDNLAMVFLGRTPEHLTEMTTDEAWEKFLTTLLLQNASYVLFDNISLTLKTSYINTVLTSDAWKGRVLGKSEAPTVPNLATWVITGNNPRMSDEIQRRCIRIRLEAKTDRPNMRTGFLHENLEQWTLSHREALIESALTLIQHYIASGEPDAKNKVAFGSFEEWARVMAGICEVNGLPDFFANAESFYDVTVSEYDEEFGEFVKAWFDTFGSRDVRSGELYKTLVKEDPTQLYEPRCTLSLGDKGDNSKMARLGRILKQRRGQVFQIGEGDAPVHVQIMTGGKSNGGWTWTLVDLEQQPPTPVSEYDVL